MKELWAGRLYKDGEFFTECGTPTRVYLADEVDAIPKLNLTGEEMAQLRSLISAALWIRGMQAHEEGWEGDLKVAVEMRDRVFCKAQFDVAVKFTARFDDWMRENSIPYFTWPQSLK